MRQQYKTSSPTPARRGVTLIEALAGLVILGTLLVSITIARGRFIRQRALAEQKLAATAAVDQLVSRWMAGGTSAIPTNAQGTLDDLPALTWRTHILHDRAAADLSASIVRLEVTDRKSTATPILTLDLLRRDDRRAPTTRGAP
jgi:type II secretory pathway pseudopilin PulG